MNGAVAFELYWRTRLAFEDLPNVRVAVRDFHAFGLRVVVTDDHSTCGAYYGPPSRWPFAAVDLARHDARVREASIVVSREGVADYYGGPRIAAEFAASELRRCWDGLPDDGHANHPARWRR